MHEGCGNLFVCVCVSVCYQARSYAVYLLKATYQWNVFLIFDLPFLIVHPLPTDELSKVSHFSSHMSVNLWILLLGSVYILLFVQWGERPKFNMSRE